MLKHLAIIMDGNGRWGIAKNNKRRTGHVQGGKTLKDIVQQVLTCNIKYLTVFALSQENLLRPAIEVNFLFKLLFETLKKEEKFLHQHNIRLVVVGEELKDAKIKSELERIQKDTEHYDSLVLNIAINYSGQWDLQQACAKAKDSNDWQDIHANLALSSIPEPCLLIRTGGFQRLSGFLLPYLSYTELYFTKTLWPDFGSEELMRVIQDFNSTQRNFGKIQESTQQDEIKAS